MTVKDALRAEAGEAAAWYGGQLRAIAARVLQPVAHAAHVVVDDAGGSVIELAATREEIRTGATPAPTPTPSRPVACREPRAEPRRAPSRPRSERLPVP